MSIKIGCPICGHKHKSGAKCPGETERDATLASEPGVFTLVFENVPYGTRLEDGFAMMAGLREASRTRVE